MLRNFVTSFKTKLYNISFHIEKKYLTNFIHNIKTKEEKLKLQTRK